MLPHRSAPDPWRVSARQRWLERVRSVRRHPARAALVVAIVAAGVVAAFAGPRDRSASTGRWRSGELVAVEGEPAGACASAFGPGSSGLDGKDWIVCEHGGAFTCYTRGHSLSFKPSPTTATRFDADCRAALAVLRKAGVLH